MQTAAPVKTPAPVSEAVNAPVDPGVPNRPSLKQSLCLYRRQNVLPPLAASVLADALVYAGQSAGKTGDCTALPRLSFLLRYTVEHSLFPLELRLAATALFAMVLLAVGWRLRHRQRIYALILRGGATGVLYLTVFGAFRLWQMLP